MLQELFTWLVRHGITPNELYILSCVDRNIYQPNFVDARTEVLSLQKKGLLTNTPGVKATLTPKAKLELAEVSRIGTRKAVVAKKIAEIDEQVLGQIARFRDMFPPGLNQVKKPWKTPVKELAPRFVEFFKDYPEHADMDLIIKVTDIYIEEKTRNCNGNYKHIRTAGYFVRKQDKDKSWSSDLASYCQLYKDGELVVPERTQQSHINVRC